MLGEWPLDAAPPVAPAMFMLGTIAIPADSLASITWVASAGSTALQIRGAPRSDLDRRSRLAPQLAPPVSKP